MTIEVCSDSVECTLAAAKYGATRVELCTALDLGGLTPSYGLIKECASISFIETHVIIRPKAGDFVYSDSDFQIMKNDIEMSAKLDAKGVVFGILNSDSNLDGERNHELYLLAKQHQLKVTFHRAFDFTLNPTKALEQLIVMGFDRILTSGQKPTALEGIETLRSISQSAGKRIEIMAGSGVNVRNAYELSNTGVDALHFTARKAISKNDPLNMGLEYDVDEGKIQNIIELVC